MFKVETQSAYNLDDLTSLQFGWDFTVSQLGPSDEKSIVSFVEMEHRAYKPINIEL